MDLVAPSELTAAAERLDSRIMRTPLLECTRLSDELGVRTLLKCENLQHTGSFKVRGALNALLIRAQQGTLAGGVATFSAGNHAAATSYAARVLGVPAVVCMPPGAVATKVEAVGRYGGEIVFTDALVDTCMALANERGYGQLHPFDDPDVIAGAGTVGIEILADCPDPDLVVLPVGGGGLVSGVSAALRAGGSNGSGGVGGAGGSARMRIVGVEPRQANAMSHALRAGTAQPLPARPSSLADGLAAPFASARTLAHVQAYVDEVLEVEEDAIADAWWAMMDATKLFVEPSAAVGLAAVRAGLLSLRPGSTVVFVLSGGNAARTSLATVAAM
jgi:threo-3-hydroxy-L-aspartate ammonia-lyase